MPPQGPLRDVDAVLRDTAELVQKIDATVDKADSLIDDMNGVVESILAGNVRIAIRWRPPFGLTIGLERVDAGKRRRRP